jgi:hypothetical protein
MATGHGWQGFFARFFLVFGCVGILGACGGSGPSQNSSANAQTGPVVSGTIAPLLPPDSAEKPPAPGSLGRGIAADGLPSMQPPKGVNVTIDTLFSDDIRDPIARSRRLETAVIELRRDLDAAMPAIKRLVAIEKDIQLLTSQLQTLLSGDAPPPETIIQDDGDVLNREPDGRDDMIGTIQDPVPHEADAAPTRTSNIPPVPPTPPATAPPITDQKPDPPDLLEGGTIDSVMETALSESSSDMPVALGPIVAEAETTTAPSPASKAPPPVSDGAVRAVGLRLGEHADKTRIVIDLTGAVVPRVDLDNIEKILVIELPQVTLAGVVDKDFQNPLIQSLSIQPLETGGTRAILLLKKDSVILSQSVLKPGSGTPHHRLVIDLKH